MATALRVVTWNVLADAYIHRDWYPRTTDAELEPSGRRARLLDAVDALDADVLCLQEVEPPLFAALERRLSARGLDGHFAQKGRNRPDGCATFVRRGLEARAPQVLRYADARGAEGHSGHLALLCFAALDGRVLGVANTHVRWDAPDTLPEAQVGLRQTTELAQALGDARDVDGWVVCGDFNATLDSPALSALTALGFCDPHDPSACTFITEGEARKIDFVLASPSLHVEAVAPRAIDATTALPSSTEPSDHLPLVATVSWAAG